jgi:hypothetical protein
MNTTHHLTKIIGGALLSGAVALAGFGLSSGTAHAFNPQPDPPGRPQPNISGRPHVSFNPQQAKDAIGVQTASCFEGYHSGMQCIPNPS